MRMYALLFTLILIPQLADAAEMDAREDAAIRAAVQTLMPQATEITVTSTPVDGLREVAIGTQILYATADGSFLLGGPLLDASSGRNLTESRVATARAQLLKDRERVQPFAWPADKSQHTITVVTDIDCPYCRKLHKEIPALNAAGVSVEYVMLPRTGRDSPSYNKTTGAACAATAETAITQAMNGANFDRATCDNPIDTHMQLARELGITSTPGIVLPSGEVVPGYRSADAILQLLDQ